MRYLIVFAALLASAPAFAGTSALIKQYDALDVKCRGGHGDDLATLRACDKRESVGKKLEKMRCTYIPSPHPTGWDCK